MEGRNILYLTYDGLADPLGQSQILPYLVGLRKLGHRITIVSFEKKERGSFVKDIETICSEANLQWIPLTYHKSPPIISTIFDLLRLSSVCKKLIQQQTFHWIHARSYLTGMVASRLTRKTSIRFLFDMRGFWADERVEGGLWSLKNPVYRFIYKFFKNQEGVLLHRAHAVVVLTQAAHQVLKDWSFVNNIYVIPCCVDERLFNPDNSDEASVLELRKSWGVNPNTFVLLYLGSLGTWYLYDEMVMFYDHIKIHFPDSKFLFLTNDAHLVESRPDFIVKSVKREDVPKYIAATQASICFIKPSFSKKGSSATKMAEVLAMRKNVITNEGWGDVLYLKDVFKQVNVLNHIDMSGVDLYFAENHDFDRKTFSDVFGLESGVLKYHAIYNQKILEKS